MIEELGFGVGLMMRYWIGLGLEIILGFDFCYYSHRDYKRIEAASGDESRNKLNKSNGGQI